MFVPFFFLFSSHNILSEVEISSKINLCTAKSGQNEAFDADRQSFSAEVNRAKCNICLCLFDCKKGIQHNVVLVDHNDMPNCCGPFIQETLTGHE